MSRVVAKPWKLRRCESGSVAVEFSLVGLAALMVSFGLIEFGRGLYLYNKLSHAADRGARKVMIDPDASNGALEVEMRSAFSPGEQGALTVAIDAETVDGVSFQKIALRRSLHLFVPGLTNRSIDLSVVRRVPKLP